MKRNNRMKKNALYAQTVAVASALLLITPLVALTGCGGGSKGSNGSPVSRATGSLTFQVKWPEQTRVVPVASQSIVLSFTRTAPGPTNGPAPRYVITAPADTATGDARITKLVVNNLELGTYSINATSFPSTDGTGTAQATTTVTKDIVQGNKNDLILTMDVTVRTLEVNPATGADLPIGSTRQLNPVAKDASGAVVLIGTANVKVIKWESLNPDVASVDQNGLVTTLSVGQATIRATYQEPTGQTVGIVGQATINTVDIGPLEGFWSKFHGDVRNTGQALTGNPTAGGLQWKFNASDKVVFSGPVVGKDGTVYVGSYDKNLYAINPDGSLRWMFATGDAIDATPIVDKNGVVYVGSYDGKMYALRGDSGQKIWEFQTDGEIGWSATLDKNGVLYFGSSGAGKTLYAVNSLDGTLKWKLEAGGPIQTSPALFASNSADTPSRLYFGCQDKKVYAIDLPAPTAGPGTVAWTFATGGEIYNSSPAVDSAGNIYIGSFDGMIYGLTPAGAPKAGWPRDLGSKIYASPAIKGNDSVVYVATYDDIADTNNKLVALDPATGTTIWEFTAPANGVTSSPAIGVDGVIYFGSYDGNIYAVNPNGSAKWSYQATEAGTPTNTIDSSPGIGPNGTVYVGTVSNSVLALQ